ncbi:hypothetical protein Cal6303_0955 [Calothrix sp. PCC 6303]|nr:hypothetical protein Cal6303_0955 [Calothrix sp. PCC 6303]
MKLQSISGVSESAIGGWEVTKYFDQNFPEMV